MHCRYQPVDTRYRRDYLRVCEYLYEHHGDGLGREASKTDDRFGTARKGSSSTQQGAVQQRQEWTTTTAGGRGQPCEPWPDIA